MRFAPHPVPLNSSQLMNRKFRHGPVGVQDDFGERFLSCCAIITSVPCLAADSRKIFIHPLKKFSLKPQKGFIPVGGRRSPRVGDEKTKSRIQSVRVTPFDSPNGGTPAKESVRAFVGRKNKIVLYALPEAAGKQFTLEVGIRSRVWEYRRDVIFLQYAHPDTPPKVIHRWVELESRESTDLYTVVVSLGKLLTLSVSQGGSAVLEMPDTVSHLRLVRPDRAKAKAEIREGNVVHIHGKKLGNEKFVSRAPEHVVEEQRERRSEAEATAAKLEQALKRLEGAL